jgi:hypothetical protein
VVRHDDIGENVEDVEFARAFEDFAEGVSGGVGAEDGAVTDATEGDEVWQLSLVVTIQAR